MLAEQALLVSATPRWGIDLPLAFSAPARYSPAMNDDDIPEITIDDDDPRYLRFVAGESPWILTEEEIEREAKVPLEIMPVDEKGTRQPFRYIRWD
jgi:hypothetical protein